ncbi:uracil-DNA glycosylase [Trichomonascus vanleenenianus]|uniref:uracil-DNA glycosylase n=1 Tax=Trichomonascus vanleenenianus TaxID=2268995 RepID=UPI003EC97159
MSKRASSITAFFQPAAKRSTISSNFESAVGVTKTAPFDKDKWVASLTPEQKKLLDLEIRTIDESWLAVLHAELTKPYFLNLKKFLKDETAKGKTIFPPEKDVYSWSRLTPLGKVRVVILGQDPYHNYNQAHGLAFSVNPPTPPPPSLRNIYKGVQRCYASFKIPKSGSLIPWAERGVLMLNACLTVEAHKANSHANKGWETFTEKVLDAAIKARTDGLCFMLWGSPAAKRMDKIKPNKSVHCILTSVHPSPLSASRGFFDGMHFSKANEWLLERYGPSGVINWALEPDNVIPEIELMRKTPEEKEAEKLLEMESDEEDNDALSNKENIAV